MKLNEFQYILDRRFQTGFEVECCINAGQTEAFKKAVQKLHPDITFVHDGSIKPKLGDDRTEINTPVLPTDQALQLLERIFELVDKYGYTNRSCGLHANFSPINRADYEKINPFWLATQPIWKQIKKTFQRERNKYCRDIELQATIKKNPYAFVPHVKHGRFWDRYNGVEASTSYKHKNAVSLWHYMIQMQNFNRFKRKFVRYAWHYSVINFDNYSPSHKPDSRIEIRGFGNENYHLRIGEIARYIERILRLFVESYDKKLETK